LKPIKKIANAVRNIPLKLKIWLYFMVFTLIVFILLWVFQIFFLEHIYESMKIRDVNEAAETLVESYSTMDSADFTALLSSTSSEHEICIEVYDKYGRSIYSREYLGDCVIHGRENNTFEFLERISSSDDGQIYYKIKNPRSGYDMLLYGCAMGDSAKPTGYILINSELVPVGSTVKIIRKQLKLITGILILIAFVISLYVSRKIAKPIENITKSAEKLAKGDFKTKFDGRGYLEAHRLADTLTYAENELSKVDTMQRDLIANISHDLRTPLTMLKAYAEMIRDLSGDNPKKRAEHLEIIINETDRLALLVNDVLDLSKLESGKQKLSCTSFDIRSKLSEIISRFKGISQKMGYHIHFMPDAERMVYCDVVKIEQVIYNLINNAINYTGADKQVYVRQINQSDGVLIEIEDTGDGIEEDKIKLIFDKYYRSENHKREVVGTGLGLSIVKAVLKLHNYDYGVKSVLGKGSIFWFKISDSPEKISNEPNQ
jgi:signal transduction histidine kinase